MKRAVRAAALAIVLPALTARGADEILGAHPGSLPRGAGERVKGEGVAGERVMKGEGLAQDAVEAREVPGPLAADPAAPLWDRLPGRTFVAAPQRAIRLNDRRANEALTHAAPRALEVRAAFDGRDLAVAVDWSDESEDRVRPDATDAFADGVALEVPLRFGAGLRLPYVGMGDDDMPVALYLARAAAEGTVVREAVAAGFGSLTRADLGGMRAAMSYDRARKGWRAVFVRPLAGGPSDLRRGLVPFALAVWDGARHERGGNKALTGWKLLRVSRFPADPAYVVELARGSGAGDPGDPARGKALAESVCAVCHVVGERRIARPGIAPDLTGIGPISTAAYLRESLVDPSAVIVPNPNANQHQDRSVRPVAGEPYPNADAFVWFQRDASGRKVSRMPSFAAMPEADLAAIVAYLMTLGAEASGDRRKP